MVVDDALRVLRNADPASSLAALTEAERSDRLRHALAGAEVPLRVRRGRLVVRAAAIAIALLTVSVGIAWAAGALTPLAVFQTSPQQEDVAPGSLFDQQVIPASIRPYGSVAIPQVGPVSFWEGRSREGGWCGALRVPDGHWIGTAAGEHRFDAGGTVPGCYPTREQTNQAGDSPSLIIDGFDYYEGDVDARAAGGDFWRIRYGRVAIPAAARVTDLVSGRSAAARNGFFMLAVPDPSPVNGPDRLHLVAYDGSGLLVGDDCSNCPR